MKTEVCAAIVTRNVDARCGKRAIVIVVILKLHKQLRIGSSSTVFVA